MHRKGDDLRELTRLETVLLSTLAGRERYGLEVRNTARELGQEVSLASLYSTLARLEELGLVTSRWGETTEARRGAHRRYYELTGLGARTLRETRQILKRALRRAEAVGFLPAEGRA